MCLHLAYGLHVLLTFAHAPWHLDMKFIAQAILFPPHARRVDRSRNSSRTLPRTGRRSAGQRSLRMAFLWMAWSVYPHDILDHQGSEKSLDFSMFLILLLSRPYNLPQKKSAASNGTTSNHRNAQWGTDSKWWRPSKNRLGSASGSIIRKKV